MAALKDVQRHHCSVAFEFALVAQVANEISHEEEVHVSEQPRIAEFTVLTTQ